MLILGLDVASLTGFAWYDTRASLSAIRTGLIRAEGENAEEKAASLAVQLHRLFYETRIVGGEAKQVLVKPDFVAIEQPMRNVKTFTKKVETLHGIEDVETINPNALQLSALVGAAVAIIAAYKIPWETIPAATWRKAAYGFGTRKGWTRVDWKRHARQMCAQHRIAATNDDMAEACWIAFAGAACQGAKMIERARAAA